MLLAIQVLCNSGTVQMLIKTLFEISVEPFSAFGLDHMFLFNVFQCSHMV